MAKKNGVKKQKQEKAVEVEVKAVKRPQTFRGRVVSAKLPQTVTVIIESRKTHPLYGKSFRRSKKFLAHADKQLTLGDLVEIVQCAPISKRKSFKVAKVFGRDIEAVATEQLKEEAAEAIAEVLPEEKEEEAEELAKKEKK